MSEPRPMIAGEALTALITQLRDRAKWAAGDSCPRDFYPQDAFTEAADAIEAVHRRAFLIDDVGDHVCAHGTAMDVHCCGCHSGFIFDRHHVCENRGENR